MDILAIVPTRGVDLMAQDDWIRLRGRPLLEYTIEAAVQASRCTRIVVTTDMEQVSAHARQLGAETPFLRPRELAAPDVSLLRVIQHCLSWLAEHESYEPEVVVLLETSHPIRPLGLIDRVIQTLLEQDLDTVFTAAECRHLFWRMESQGDLIRVNWQEDSTRATRRLYYEQLHGLVCATRMQSILRDSLIGEKVGIVPVRGLLGLVDIQDEERLELAEFLLEREVIKREFAQG